VIEVNTEFQTDRRFVTIMFADLSGFTSLAEILDPEEMQELLNACFNVLVPIIEKNGGSIDKFIGDEIMAVFGAPLAMENSAKAAMNAALEMLEAMEKFKMERTQSLGIHIGINSGTVVAGGIGSKGRMQYTVIGDAVNLAARLTSAAPEKEVYVGKESYLLAKTHFEFKKLKPAFLKGKQEKIEFYKLLAKQKENSSHTNNLLIGRDYERQEIMQFALRKNANKLRLISITGNPGIGKSRLLDACTDELKKDFIPVKVNSGITTTPKPFEGIKQLLTIWLNANDTKTQTQLLTAIQLALDQRYFQFTYEELDWITQFLKPNAELPLNQWINDPNWAGRLSNILVSLLENLIQHQKVWLEIDNFANIDSYSLEILSFCTKSELKSKSIICLECRNPETLKKVVNPDIDFPSSQILQLEIRPLNPIDSEKLLLSQLPDFSIDPINLEEIIKKSEGNPLYLTAIASSYKSSSLGHSHKKAIPQPSQFHELGSIILDALPSHEKHLCGVASVIGREFSLSDLIYLANPDFTKRTIEKLLVELTKKELFIQTKTDFYSFSKEFIYQSAYTFFLLTERKKLHQKYANYLIEKQKPNAIKLLSEIAMHLENSGDTNRALEFYLEAHKRNFKSGLFKESYIICQKIDELISGSKKIKISSNQLITFFIQYAELNYKFLQIEKGINCINRALACCGESNYKSQIEIKIALSKLHIQNRNGDAGVRVLKPLIKNKNTSNILNKEKALFLKFYLTLGQAMYFSNYEAELYEMLADKNNDFSRSKDTAAQVQFNDLWILWACHKYRFYNIPETYVTLAKTNTELASKLKNTNDFFISKNILSLLFLWNGELNKSLLLKIENGSYARKISSHTNLLTELNYQAFIYRCLGKFKAMDKVLHEAFQITNKVKSSYLIHLRANQLVGKLKNDQLDSAASLSAFIEKAKSAFPENYPLKFFWEGPLFRYYITTNELEKAHACLQFIFHPSQRAWPEPANTLNERLNKAFEGKKKKEFLKISKELIQWSDTNQQGLV